MRKNLERYVEQITQNVIPLQRFYIFGKFKLESNLSVSENRKIAGRVVESRPVCLDLNI